MATGAIVFSWGAGIPGREAKALEVFGRSLQQAEEDLKTGRIHGHKEYFSIIGPNGGYQILEGEIDELMSLLADDAHQTLLTQARAIVEDFDVTICQGGSDASVQDGVMRFGKAMQEIGYL